MYGYGLQHWPFLERKYGFSSLFEFNYCFPQEKGWEVGFQFATDRGSFYGNNIGALLRIAKSGQLMR